MPMCLGGQQIGVPETHLPVSSEDGRLGQRGRSSAPQKAQGSSTESHVDVHQEIGLTERVAVGTEDCEEAVMLACSRPAKAQAETAQTAAS